MTKGEKMNRFFTIKVLSFITITGAILLVGICFAYDDGDWQYWNTENIGGKIIDVRNDYLDSIKAMIEAEFRWGDDVSELYYYHGDLGITLNKLFASWFSLGLNYRQVYELKSGEWTEENRPHLNGTIKLKWEGWDISNRCRFEYRDTESYNDWRFRNKLTAKFPWKWTSWQIRPYVADEIFYDFHADELNRNRLYAGIGIGKLFLLETIKGDVFFLWQSTKKPNWGDQDYYIFGTKLKVNF